MFPDFEALVTKITSFPRVCGDVPDPHQLIQTKKCFPRVCGDVPRGMHSLLPKCMFSPRMRGCSSVWQLNHRIVHVFPAYAGMFLKGGVKGNLACNFPRVCGDVPSLNIAKRIGGWFSPRMRGCSYHQKRHAIMHFSFPRVCGDVPQPT